MNENKIGLGYQNFAAINKEHIFHIDKTYFISDWWGYADKVTLLHDFFSNQYAGRSDLFEGLSIWEEKTSSNKYT